MSEHEAYIAVYGEELFKSVPHYMRQLTFSATQGRSNLGFWWERKPNGGVVLRTRKKGSK